jgi:hypothetical protein
MRRVRMPCITWGEPGEDYFENPVVTQSQFKEAVKLCNNFLYAQDKEDKITLKDVEDFLDVEAGDGNEVWLLHRMQNTFFPVMRKATLKKHVQQGIPIPYGMRYAFPSPPKYLQAFEATLFISASISKGGLYVDADVLAREPWADTALCAYWADKRLRAASEALGGASELRITATERDIALQRELKALGYFCFDWDRQAGEYHFSKILELRSRKDALAPLKGKPNNRKKF